jgi:hypothetical protein
VQHVNEAGELHGVDGAVCVAVEILDDLENSRAAEALQWLCIRMSRPALSGANGKSEDILDRLRHRGNIGL